MIELEHVYKQFGGRQVLSDVSFEIRRGETFVIIGRSGVGKTVILKHISGLLDPDRGSVSIDGTTISHSSNSIFMALLAAEVEYPSMGGVMAANSQELMCGTRQITPLPRW